jgi:SAM-dependent methyltransferase
VRATAQEIERIRAAYRERDAAASATSSYWLDPAYRLRLQELEWALLGELARAWIETAGARVLEVGCGDGYFLSRFLDYGAAHATGIDLMEERVAKGSERDPRLELLAGDASKLPWADGSFDLVTQFTCLSSVLDADLREGIASEMWRVVAPGGAVVSYDVGPDPWPIRAFRRMAALRAGSAPAGGTPTAPVGRAELADWFPGARCRRVGLYPELGKLLGRAPLIARALGKLPGLQVHLLALATKPGPGGIGDPASQAGRVDPSSPRSGGGPTH